MFIKEIRDYDKDALEADILISDSMNEVLCYAHSFVNFHEDFSLKAFMTKNIMRALDNTSSVKKNEDGYYSYKLQGKLVDIINGGVLIDNIKIQIDGDFPGDISVGEFIEFDVFRIDSFQD